MTNIEKYGFSLVRTREIDEIGATLYELQHEKIGTRIIYLDRDDDNKTFSIGFATPPEDDTGVFHIIEHSVLCGSKKYPLNDPFAELLKGSLNTFLNAITFEDRTIYPVSSRCERDFLNLVDVYMDAVLAPNMLENPSIFRQEGWHYEYDKEKNLLTYNGVVYNEMKGAYSSADELGGCALNRALFDGTSYSKDSGGNPSAIPSLTYEQFKATHQKYYHPSSARIVIDGKIDLDKILPLIDSHLDRFDKSDRLYLTGKSTPHTSPTVEVKYEISENEDEHGKARVLYGFVCSDYTDKDALITASILSEILCGSNASPLKKAILDSGLAKDAAMYSSKSREQSLIIEVRDADETRLDEIDSLITKTITDIATNGIDKKNIISSLNSFDFRRRERDYGTLPTGIVLALSIHGDWVYCDTPEESLLMNDVTTKIREKVGTDHFEKSLLNFTINNPHRAKVVMLPDKTLSERSAREEKEILASILGSMTEEEKERIIDEEAELRAWQQREPCEDELNRIPKLAITDIPPSSLRPHAEVSEIGGVKVLKCHMNTNGIVYISLLFDASDLCEKDLISLSMLSAALFNFPTKNYDALSLQNEVKANLGGMFASFSIGNDGKNATPYLKISAKALSSQKEHIIRLFSEVLFNSVIENEEEMSKILLQAKSHMEDALISSGESVALSRIEAGIGEAGAIAEYLSGYEAYCVIREICKDNDKVVELTQKVKNLLIKLVDRSRLTVAITGEANDDFIRGIISIFPDGGILPEKKHTPICAENSEFFLLPSKVAYAAIGGKSDEVEKNLGLMRVVRSILSYEYLWNTVRVQSGAYGTGVVPRKDGSLSFYSYRDPSPARSLGFYKDSSNYLRELADSGEDITKFIIGAIGEYDTLITPRTAAAISLGDYLNGWTPEAESMLRGEMLSVTAEDLRVAADIIDSVISNGSTIIVGGAEHLDTLPNRPKKIITI